MRFLINIVSVFSLFFMVVSAAAAENFELNNKTILGSTPITAQLSTATYHSRALEDALRKLLAHSANTVTGFTLVEDGKLLIDQIQSKANVLIHEYKVMNVKQDARDYKLEVNFLYSNSETRQSTARCGSNLNRCLFPVWLLHGQGLRRCFCSCPSARRIFRPSLP